MDVRKGLGARGEGLGNCRSTPTPLDYLRALGPQKKTKCYDALQRENALGSLRLLPRSPHPATRIPHAVRRTPTPMSETLHTIANDLRYALRQIRRGPALATAAILCFALGIGANTSIFTVVNGVLFRPLPFADPDRLVTVLASFLPARLASRIDPK